MNKHHSTLRRGNHDMSKMDKEQEQVVDRSENNNKIMLKDFDLQGKVGVSITYVHLPNKGPPSQV